MARTEKRSREIKREDGGEKEKGKGSCSKPLLYINIIIRYNNWILDIINLWISVSVTASISVSDYGYPNPHPNPSDAKKIASEFAWDADLDAAIRGFPNPNGTPIY